MIAFMTSTETETVPKTFATIFSYFIIGPDKEVLELCISICTQVVRARDLLCFF